MTKQNHTPGPWTVQNRDTGAIDERAIYGCSRGKSPFCVASVADWPNTAEANANAHLVAAAPLMLDEIKNTIHQLQEMEIADTLSNIRQIKLIEELELVAAIAKGEIDGQN